MEENRTIIRAINKFGRVPETHELLDEIDRLNNIINELERKLNNYDLDYMDMQGEHMLADTIEDIRNTLKELKEKE